MTYPQSTQYDPAPPPSAMTAAGSIGRFLARNPQFAQVPSIHWEPSPQGWVTVHIAHMHPESERLMREIAEAMGLPLHDGPYQSMKYGSVRSLHVFGAFDGAQWYVGTLIPMVATAALAVSR